MSTTESDSEHEYPTETLSTTLTAFARLSTTRPSQGPVSWAVDTLATLDFRLVRKDTALHGLIHDCASTILALFDDVLQPERSAPDTPCNFIPDIASILKPSFLHLLFQYRRLFRIIAARGFIPNSAPLAIICWVDLVLAKLGDVIAFIAAGLDGDHPDRSLPESLAAQREEDNLRAAIQLPDNWDTLPSMLLSQPASVAARRLSTRLLLGRYILCPALTGQVGMDNTIHGLLSTFAEFVRQIATRLGELRSVGLQYLLQQERLTSAMAISLFAAADMAKNSVSSERVATFRPQTMASAMQILRFVLDEGGCLARTNIPALLAHLDIPTSVIMRWGVVPQWAWNIWLEYRSLYADTIMCLTMTYIQHQETSSGALLEISDLVSPGSWASNEAGVISVIVDLVFRFISMVSANGHSQQLSTGMIGVLDGSCRLISQWINRNSCGIQSSMECCKALIILFGYLSQNEQHLALNDLVIECLASMRAECTRDAWKAAVEDTKFCFLEALGQSFMQIKVALSLSHDDLPKASKICAVQLMQFLVVIMSKGIQPPDLDTLVKFIETVKERVLEAPRNGRSFLWETFLTCLASANLSEIDFPFSKVMAAADEEAIWRLGMCNGGADLFLASAFSLYISSGLVSVEPLTYLEGLEHLVDVALLICSRHYPRDLEPLALTVLPTICDALAHLLEHRDGTTGVYVSANTQISALGSVLQSLCNEENSMPDGFGAVLKRRLSLTARRVLGEINGKQDTNESDEQARGEYELMSCRLDGFSHLLYMVI